MHVLRRIATGLFIVFLPVLLVTSNIRYLAGDVRFYEHGFREYNSVEATGVPLYELDRAAGEIVDYFENDVSELRLVVSTVDREEPLFNEKEIADRKSVV